MALNNVTVSFGTVFSITLEEWMGILMAWLMLDVQRYLATVSHQPEVTAFGKQHRTLVP